MIHRTLPFLILLLLFHSGCTEFDVHETDALMCQPITAQHPGIEGLWEGIDNESRTLYHFAASGSYRLFALNEEGRADHLLSRGNYVFRGDRMTFSNGIHKRTERVTLDSRELRFLIDDDRRRPPTYLRVDCSP